MSRQMVHVSFIGSTCRETHPVIRCDNNCLTQLSMHCNDVTWLISRVLVTPASIFHSVLTN